MVPRQAAAAIDDALVEDVVAAFDVRDPAGRVQREVDRAADLHPVAEVQPETEIFLDAGIGRRGRLGFRHHLPNQ